MKKIQERRLPETVNMQEVRAYMHALLLENRITEQEWDQFELASRIYQPSTVVQPAGKAAHGEKAGQSSDSVQVRIAAVNFLPA
jgi:hypothetical protein